MALCHALLGETAKAIQAANSAVQLSDNNPFCLIIRAIVYARTGQAAMARSELEKLNALSNSLYVDQGQLADIHAELGDFDTAFERLEEAATQPGWNILMLRVFHRIELYGQDPRCWRLVDRLKFPPLPIYHPHYELEQRMRFGEGRDEEPQNVRSIAILPFDDLKPDEEFGWLSDAMADEIRSRLDTLDGVTVRRSHTPLKRFTDQGKSVSEVARELDVDALVQGNFVHHSGALRSNVSLYGTDGQDSPLAAR